MTTGTAYLDDGAPRADAPPAPAKGRPGRKPIYPAGSRRVHRKKEPGAAKPAAEKKPDGEKKEEKKEPDKDWLPPEYKKLLDELPPPEVLAYNGLIMLSGFWAKKTNDARSIIVAKAHAERISKPLATAVVMELPDMVKSLSPQERVLVILALSCVPAVMHYASLDPIPIDKFRAANTRKANGQPGAATPPADPGEESGDG